MVKRFLKTEYEWLLCNQNIADSCYGFRDMYILDVLDYLNALYEVTDFNKEVTVIIDDWDCIWATTMIGHAIDKADDRVKFICVSSDNDITDYITHFTSEVVAEKTITMINEREVVSELNYA